MCKVEIYTKRLAGVAAGKAVPSGGQMLSWIWIPGGNTEKSGKSWRFVNTDYDPCCTAYLACQIRARLRGWSILIICNACWLLITTPRLCYLSLFSISFFSISFILSSPFLFLCLILCFFSTCRFLSKLFSPHSTSFTCFPFCSFRLLNSVGGVFFILPFPSPTCSSKYRPLESLPRNWSFEFECGTHKVCAKIQQLSFSLCKLLEVPNSFLLPPTVSVVADLSNLKLLFLDQYAELRTLTAFTTLKFWSRHYLFCLNLLSLPSVLIPTWALSKSTPIQKKR